MERCVDQAQQRSRRLTPAASLLLRGIRGAGLLAFAALALTAPAGCATGKPLPQAFHDVLRDQRDVNASASLADLSPTSPALAVFRLYEGGEALSSSSSAARLMRTATLEPDAHTLRITRVQLDDADRDAEGTLEMASTLVRVENGWAMTRAETPTREVITEYDPPMLVYPSAIAPGEPLSQEVKLVVRPIDHPDRVQNRGEATNTIELIGWQRVRTRLGDVEALRVRATFIGSFGPAKVRRVTDTWHAPGLGLVAEETHERVTALGAPISAIDQALLLISADGQAPMASRARSTSASDISQ